MNFIAISIVFCRHECLQLLQTPTNCQLMLIQSLYPNLACHGAPDWIATPTNFVLHAQSSRHDLCPVIVCIPGCGTAVYSLLPMQSKELQVSKVSSAQSSHCIIPLQSSSISMLQSALTVTIDDPLAISHELSTDARGSYRKLRRSKIFN